jgi:SPP1 family predicted phage head-tail adaptor
MRTNKQVKSGDLSERIEFINPDSFSDGFGGYYSSFGVFYTCWASIQNKSGARQNSEDQMVIKNTWEVLIRFNPLVAITKSMHINYDGKILVIDSIIDLENHKRMIKIIAKERD